MKITFIDFETANRERTSICSVGVSVQENGREVDSFYSLIKPDPFNVEEMCKKAHGLDYCDLINAPDFLEVYDTIISYFNNIVVAHNASFDMDCLSTLLYKLELPFPSFYYLDSLQVARSRFANADLETLASHYNIGLENHHNALSDARVLGYIYWNLRKDLTPEFCRNFLKDFRERFYIEVDQEYRDLISPKKHLSDVTLTKGDLPFTNPENIEFFGKRFVVTGNFAHMSRKSIEDKIISKGGVIQNTVNGKTNYMIIGSIASSGWANGNYGRKIETALTLPNVIFIDESNFIKYI